MKTVVIIQARMTSERLPGKVLKPIGGIPMLQRVVERSRQIRGVSEVWVAAADDGLSEPIDSLCRQISAPVQKGSVEDVTSRYLVTAKAAKADVILRITSDCPFLDPDVASEVVHLFQSAKPSLDYASNTGPNRFPRGFDTEIFTMAALERAHMAGTLKPDREHVTHYIYTHPQSFSIAYLEDPLRGEQMRLTVDTLADYQMACALADKLKARGAHDRYADIREVMNQFPEIAAMNSNIRQKDLA